MSKTIYGVNPTTLRKEDVGWLAGLMDGEGCIHTRKNGAVSYASECCIVSTSYLIISKLARLLKQAKIQYWLSKPQVSVRSSKHSDRYTLKVYRIWDMMNFLKLMIPELSLKKEKAKILVSLLEKRVKHSWNDHYYTDSEKRILVKILALQRKSTRKKI